MVWVEFILEQFGLVGRFTADESEFYGPYNSLLHDLFPGTEQYYQVGPQLKRIAGSMDFTFLYIVMKRRVPVLFIEIKTFLCHDNSYSRAVADHQMREKFLDVASGSLPKSKLIGVNAMGTRFAVYEYTPQNRQLIPSRIMPHPNFINDTAPKERWNYDILEAGGEAKFRAIVAEIKTMSLAISGDCEYYSFSFSRPFC
jgi:hypothetical protein